VIQRSQRAGLNATAVQNPLTSLADDAAATRLYPRLAGWASWSLRGRGLRQLVLRPVWCFGLSPEQSGSNDCHNGL